MASAAPTDRSIEFEKLISSKDSMRDARDCCDIFQRALECLNKVNASSTCYDLNFLKFVSALNAYVHLLDAKPVAVWLINIQTDCFC